MQRESPPTYAICPGFRPGTGERGVKHWSVNLRDDMTPVTQTLSYEPGQKTPFVVRPGDEDGVIAKFGLAHTCYPTNAGSCWRKQEHKLNTTNATRTTTIPLPPSSL